MKRVISLTLVVTLLMSICMLTTVGAEEIGLQQLPEVGQVISGFKVVEIGFMDIVNAKTVLFEHEKTGAKLYYIQSKDIDRSFEIAFRTPAVDDTGVNHILEHITISGSQKYPLKNVLFTIANQTYSTFINAFTSATATVYPVSSMSEEQLLKLSEVYLDCVYNPSVYSDKNIFLREAWRYEMADADAPLLINGTVYNEMKGSLGNISTAARYNVSDALFPNSIQSNISGGDPEKIKDLTYEQLVQTHQNYYHPSNSMMILYGNLDYTRFLKMIDEEVLSGYEKKDVQIDYGKIEPLQQKTEAVYPFAVNANANTVNAAQIDYAFALTDVTEEEALGLAILATILNQDSSPLKIAFTEKQIGGQLVVSMNDSNVQPIFTFTAMNADAAKKNDFMALVDSCLDDLVKIGYDRGLVNATISSTLLSYSNLTEMSNLGINISLSAAMVWANTGNIDYFSNLIKNLNNVSEKIDDNYLEELTAKYIHNNNHAALVATVPEPGLTEKLAEEQLTALANLKASMSTEELDSIVNNTKSYSEWSIKETDQAIIDALQVVKVADLPVEVKKYSIHKTQLPDGVRMLSSAADVAGTGFTTLMLDTSAVPIEKLHFLSLYASLLGRLGTQQYPKDQLGTLSIRYLNGLSTSLSTISQVDSDAFVPVLAASWMGLSGEYDKQVELVKEILLNTQFNDANAILTIVKEQISSMQNQFVSNPLSLLMTRNMASLKTSNNYESYLYGLEYFGFLTQLEQLLQSEPGIVLAELEAIHQLILNRTNLTTLFAGSEASIEIHETEIKKFIETLPVNPIVSQDYTQIPLPAHKEGIAMDTPVQYNMISADFEAMGTNFSGKYIPIGLVISENYITPKIRFENGAYDSIANFSNDSFMLVSYRDPNINETFEVFKGLPDFIRNLTITQEELDRYILKAFSSYTAAQGELSGAMNTMSNYLVGRTSEDRLEILQEIKSTTVQDLKDTAAMFESFFTKGAWSTIGSVEKIEASKDLYDSVISFGQQSNEPVSRAQLFELILAGVPEPVSVAKQAGLFLGDGEGNYFEDEKLTMEQLAVILNRLAVLNGVQLGGENVAIADEAEISSWAKNSVQAMVASGVAKLDEDGNYHPKADVTASFVQAIMNELMRVLTGQ